VYNIPALIGTPAFLEALADSLERGVPPPLLRDAKIKLTSRCNLRCVMCKYWQTEREDTLSSERWREVFGELAELGVPQGALLGRRGLPAARLPRPGRGRHRAWAEGERHHQRYADRSRRPRTASWPPAGSTALSISLDGPTARTHDAVRGQAQAFRRSVRTIRRLREHGLKRVRINFVVMRGNYRRLPAMVRLAGALGAEELLPMPVDEKTPRHRLSRAADPRVQPRDRARGPRAAAALRLLDVAGARPSVRRHRHRGEGERGGPLRARAVHAAGVPGALAAHVLRLERRDLSLLHDQRADGRARQRGAPVRARDLSRRCLPGRSPPLRRGRHLASCHRCDLFLPENAQLHAALDQAGERRGAVVDARGPAAATAE
jgi:hypothetical protein